jgi:predicted nicotinamide N-methyase
MKYPNELIKLEKGWSVYIPTQNLVKPTYEQLLASNVTEPFPFWAKLWASSKVLSQYLIANPQWVKDKVILEMGAGIGQPSLIMAQLAKEVIITDHNKEAVELLEKNIAHLGLTNACAMQLDWSNYNNSINADTILLSDINYAPEAFAPLLNTIVYYIDKGAVIIIATPQRIMGAPFIQSLQHYVKHSETKPVLEQDTEVMISLFVLYK